MEAEPPERTRRAAVFPGALGLFKDLDSPISLAFLARFGSQDAAGHAATPDPARALEAAAPRSARSDG